jgi:hypothetical protein
MLLIVESAKSKRQLLSILTSSQAEQEAVLTAARLIMAAVTTLQTRGVSTVSSVLIQGEEKERLAKAMEVQFSKKQARWNLFPGTPRTSGELRRRAAEGLDLIPIAPRTEMDLSVAWKLSRVIKRLLPDIIHAHDAHAIAMASLALLNRSR